MTRASPLLFGELAFFVDTESFGPVPYWRRVSARGPGACENVISLEQTNHGRGSGPLDQARVKIDRRRVSSVDGRSRKEKNPFKCDFVPWQTIVHHNNIWVLTAF
jgi:hypothetical protein